jgi:hypothetical protein
MPQINRTGDVKSKIINVDFKCSGSARVVINFPRRRRNSVPQCVPPPPLLLLSSVPPGTPDAFEKALLVKTAALACTAASALTGQREMARMVITRWPSE